MAWSTRPPSSGPADDGQLDVALGAQLGHRLEQGDQALHRARRCDEVTMMRPGTGVTSSRGRNTVWSTPTGTTVIRSGVDAHLGGDVVARVLRHREHGRERARHADLHAEEAEPAPRGEALPRVGRVRQGQLAVDRDRVVQGGQAAASRPRPCRACPVPRHWLSCTTSKSSRRSARSLAGPPRVGQRLAESGRAHDAELDPVLSARRTRGDAAPGTGRGLGRGRGRRRA